MPSSVSPTIGAPLTTRCRADDIQAQFKSNVFGQLSLIQALVPPMRARGSGIFYNFSSIAGFAGNAPFGAYNASKAALEGTLRPLRRIMHLNRSSIHRGAHDGDRALRSPRIHRRAGPLPDQLPRDGQIDREPGL